LLSRMKGTTAEARLWWSARPRKRSAPRPPTAVRAGPDVHRDVHERVSPRVRTKPRHAPHKSRRTSTTSVVGVIAQEDPCARHAGRDHQGSRLGRGFGWRFTGEEPDFSQCSVHEIGLRNP
jgi:hypothetical protein